MWNMNFNNEKDIIKAWVENWHRTVCMHFMLSQKSSFLEWVNFFSVCTNKYFQIKRIAVALNINEIFEIMSYGLSDWRNMNKR